MATKEEVMTQSIGKPSCLTFFEKEKKNFISYHLKERSKNIKKGKLIDTFKENLKLLDSNTENEMYFFLNKKKEVTESLHDIKCLNKNAHFLFKLEQDEILIYGKENLFLKGLRRYSRKHLKKKLDFVERNEKEKVLDNFNPKEFLKKIINLTGDIYIYEILLNRSLDSFKNIRCNFTSDTKTENIINYLKKEDLYNKLLKNLKLEDLKSVSFKDNVNQETLKVNRLEANKYEFEWKRKKPSSLRKDLTKLLEIKENKAYYYTSEDSLFDLLSELDINQYKEKYKYKKTLEKYKKFIQIEDKKIIVKRENILKELKKLLNEKYEVKRVKTTYKKKMFFPSAKAKYNDNLLKITNKVTKSYIYLYINETALYEEKNNFLHSSFIFMPSLILDVRCKKSENYYISFAEFLLNLKDEKAIYFEKLFENAKKEIILDIETKSFEDLFNVAFEKLMSFDEINDKLSSQQKGFLFEKMILVLFSILFKTEMLGGPNKHDGNIFISDNKKIGYDAKNLENNVLGSFIHKKTGKFKDIGYIKKNQFKNYFFVFKSIDNVFFNTLVEKIKENDEGFYIKAFDIKFLVYLFNEIKSEGIINFHRTKKNNLIEELLKEEDKIIKNGK